MDPTLPLQRTASAFFGISWSLGVSGICSFAGLPGCGGADSRRGYRAFGRLSLWPVAFGVLLSTIGLTLGSYIAFALGRYLGRPFVERFVAPSTTERFDYLLHHKGAFLVFLLFLIPGFPKDALCYLLGLGHLSTMEFLLIGGVGRLLGTILLTMEGNYLRLHQYGRLYILVGITLIIVLIAMVFKDKLERLFQHWHSKDYRKKDAKPLPNPE